MKKAIIGFLAVTMAFTIFAGCNKNGDEDKKEVKPTVTASATVTPSSTPTQWKASLYFPDQAYMYLVREEKVISNGSALDVSGRAKLLLNELIAGDNTVIPAGVRVLSTSFSNGILTVDLSGEFDRNLNGGSTAVNMVLGQIVLTLTELDEVKSVQFKIEGNVVDEFKGLVTLNKPFTRDDYRQLIR